MTDEDRVDLLTNYMGFLFLAGFKRQCVLKKALRYMESEYSAEHAAEIVLQAATALKMDYKNWQARMNERRAGA